MERLLGIGLSKSKTKGTRTTYSSHANTYIRYCGVLQIDPFEPITERDLCLICWLWCRDNQVTGIPSWLSGVEYFCRQHRLPRLPRGADYKENLQTLELIFGQLDVATPAATLSETELIRVCLAYSVLFGPAQAAELIAASLWCYGGLFRASEVVWRMQARDIERFDWGVRVTLPYSKKIRTPVKVHLVRTGGLLCPVAAFERMPAHRGPISGNESLFRFSYDFFNASLGKAAAKAGVERVTTHSLRRSGTTALFLAGAPAEMIMAHGRWRSDCYRKYVDLGIKHSQHPPILRLLTQLTARRQRR